jgi:hypothetical protein
LVGTTSANTASTPASRDSLIADDASFTPTALESCCAADKTCTTSSRSRCCAAGLVSNILKLAVACGQPRSVTVGVKTIDGAEGRPIIPDDDDGPVPLGAVETDRNAVVHGEADGRAILLELGIDDAGERPGEIDVATGKIEDDLLGGNLAGKRGEVDIEAPHRASKFIDVREPEYLRRQAGLENITFHSIPVGIRSLISYLTWHLIPVFDSLPAPPVGHAALRLPIFDSNYTGRLRYPFTF